MRIGFGLVCSLATPIGGGRGVSTRPPAPRNFSLLLLLLFILGFQEADALAAQIAPSAGPREVLVEAIRTCWLEAKTIDNPLRIKLSLKADGSLAAKPILVRSKDASSDIMADAGILRAITRCSPFKGLRAFRSSYRDWRETTVEIEPPIEPAPSAASIVMTVPHPAIAKADASLEGAMTAAVVVALALLFQMLSDGVFALLRWRRYREVGTPGPWQPVRVTSSHSARRRSQPLDPVSDPKNWRE